MVDGPFQHFKSAVFDACRDLNSASLCKRKGFRGGPLLDFRGSMQLLFSSHVRDRDKALLREILSGGVWNGFLLGKVQWENVPCRFCGGPDGDGHLFWECSYQLCLLFGIAMNFIVLLVWISLTGVDAFSGMVGYHL